MGSTTTQAVPHPAKFSDALLPVIAEHLEGYWKVLDPMAGVGTLARYLYGHRLWSNELEPEWAVQCPVPRSNFDARSLPFAADSFDAIATSPTYGNRMADHHVATERCRSCGGTGADTGGGQSRVVADCGPCGGTGRRLHKRHTYRHYLGRSLTPGNTGQMQWGDEYRQTHQEIIAECVRVLRPGGRVVWNVKNHIRKGQVVDVVRWHENALADAGLILYGTIHVPCPGQRHGANGLLRVDEECVLVFDKPEVA